MAVVVERGFTIIELMLFLGVTGALFAALMIGVNVNITQQRYRDGVLGYSTLLQNQYSEVLDTSNSRDNSFQCTYSDTDGLTIDQPANGGVARGTTSCVILGRAIEIESKGSAVKTASVVGYKADDLSGSDEDDITALSKYHMALYEEKSETLDWDVSLTTTDHTPSSASFLILRSPVSGLIKVFTLSESLPVNIATAISASSASTALKNCVSGETGSLPKQSVTIDPRIAGLNGVIVNGADSECAK